MDSKKVATCAGAALVLGTLYLAWLWQPERQARLHQAGFLKAVERRNWKAADRFVAKRFADRWGHDKEFVLREAREVFRHFLFVDIAHEITDLAMQEESARVQARLRISGSGSPVAEIVMAKVNPLGEPFVFEWVKAGWAPWDWELRAVDHPHLELDHSGGF